jgi:HlyD family secretion protein
MALPRLPRAALLAVIVALLAAAVATLLYWRATAVEVVRVENTKLRQTVVVSGRVLTPAKVDIGATITGRVQSVQVDEGDRVKADQLLIELERAALAAALAQAVAAEQAALTRIAQWRDVGSLTAREQLAQAEANYRNVERDTARQEQLFGQGFIGEARVDEARRALTVAQASCRPHARQRQRMHDGRGSPPARRSARTGACGAGNGGRKARADRTASACRGHRAGS